MTVSTTHDGRSLPALEAFDFPVGLVLTGDGQVLAEAGETDEVFPFASVTKPIVAWSALVAVDRGLLSLDDPATPASSGDGGGAGGSDDGGARAGHQVALPGATMRHLLSHSSGIAFDSDAVLVPPARRRVYSNRGIEILGERLVEATGTPLEEWVETTVLEPLGMASVSVPGSPAYSGQGSAGDLSLFARELAAPTLVSPSLARQACDVVLPELDGVLPGYGRQSPNDFGLGVEIRGSKHPHWTGAGNSPQTFGHFGQAGSFIWVDPVAGRQAVFLGARPFGRTHVEAWPALSDQLLAL
ncbi:MAG: serine hydrolase domain-containing protein [Actinomyces urogenitalis]|uniref:serine hydrolase domain-containing protein n=1 Tax=Actinomyces urogenitalis TaxID=103621 RepID=UPI001897ED61|nr:serine hydrolase domain-containing protein [Actinomyces urogenitalis]MDU6152468.1 serine hydrolase domain-containing protein [Actinomyces urogenitalis]